MKKVLFLLLVGLISIGFAQETENEEGWKTGGTTTLNLSQITLTNWAAGGQNSLSINGLINLHANYKKGNGLWENNLEIGYGSLKQGTNESWWKTDDKFDLTSKYGQKAFSNWYYAALFNFKSQFAAGYNYPDDSTKISNFLAPGYVLCAIGLDYKPSDNFTAFITPVTAKFTIVIDQDLADAGAFGVDPGENLRSEIGGYARIFYSKEIMENITAQTKLDLFTNYLENPQNIDISWEVLVSMKVNKYISATLSTHLLYDDDINIPDKKSPGVQFKEVLGVGFSYQF